MTFGDWLKMPFVLFSAWIGAGMDLLSQRRKAPTVAATPAAPASVQTGHSTLTLVLVLLVAFMAACCGGCIVHFAAHGISWPNWPIPGPGPGPRPIPEKGLHVLVVTKSRDLSHMTKGQVNALMATEVKEYLNTHCALEKDGEHHAWRMWDESVDTANEDPVWQEAMKRERKSLPWVVISSDKGGYEGPLPDGPDEFLKLLKKYGGS